MMQYTDPPGKRYQTLLMTNAEVINMYIKHLPGTSRILGRMLPFSDPRDDIAWEIITQARRFPDGRFEVQTAKSQEWCRCYGLCREDYTEVTLYIPVPAQQVILRPLQDFSTIECLPGSCCHRRMCFVLLEMEIPYESCSSPGDTGGANPAVS